MDEKPKAKRGFAAMSPEKRQAIARMGGKSVPREKRSFSANPEMASLAGKKGGKAVRSEKRSFSVDPKLAREAGRNGGLASSKARAIAASAYPRANNRAD